MAEKSKEESFRVVDRRRFTETGDARPDVDAPQDRVTAEPPKAPPPPKPQPSVASTPTKNTPPSPKSSGRAATRPPTREGGQGIEFSHFVLSLATSAQMAMGLMANPEANVMHQDFAAARQTIDIIAMLQDKTQGNLSPEEAQLVEEIVYTLRMQYVQVTTTTGK